MESLDPEKMMKYPQEYFILATLAQLAKNLNKQAQESKNSLSLYKEKQSGDLEEQRKMLKQADIINIAICSSLQDALLVTIRTMEGTLK